MHPASPEPPPWAQVQAALGAQVLERDWLSSNQVVFDAHGDEAACVVDTGFQAHAPLTVALVEQALRGQRLGRIVNTHLHSDHCGANQALQQVHGCSVAVPVFSVDAVRTWDARQLTFDELDQNCPRFTVADGLQPGGTVRLGALDWQVLHAPGHDAQAVMFFEPQHRVLIAGDALWQHNVAIIFPELDGLPGFADAAHTLDGIEALQPQWVVPGHGRPFADVAGALHRSRQRLAAFQQQPQRHTAYAVRALVMFHMLTWRRLPRTELLRWMAAAPLFERLARQGHRPDERQVLDGLFKDGHLRHHALTDEVGLRHDP